MTQPTNNATINIKDAETAKTIRCAISMMDNSGIQNSKDSPVMQSVHAGISEGIMNQIVDFGTRMDLLDYLDEVFYGGVKLPDMESKL